MAKDYKAFRMDLDVHERLLELRDLEGRNMNEILREALEKYDVEPGQTSSLEVGWRQQVVNDLHALMSWRADFSDRLRKLEKRDANIVYQAIRRQNMDSDPPEKKKEVTVEEAIKKIAVEEVPWEGESEFPEELEIPKEEPVEETGNLFTEENLQLMNMSTLEAARYLREKKERESE